jgi:hypothetical protein
MSEVLSLSIFTIEADLKPVLAFATKKYHEAEVFFRDERVRSKLRSVSCSGVPLCDDYSIAHSVGNGGRESRIPRSGEAAIVHGKPRDSLSGRCGRNSGKS